MPAVEAARPNSPGSRSKSAGRIQSSGRAAAVPVELLPANGAAVAAAD
jgi:hypothetical protein